MQEHLWQISLEMKNFSKLLKGEEMASLLTGPLWEQEDMGQIVF